MNIAVIPARSGSKRIPKKNIKDFMGKPMISYAIKAAKEADIFDVVMVSTDSEEIAEIAKQYGAEVPFLRSEKNASDTATTFDVLEEVFLEYQKMQKVFDTVCCIYPCVPFLTGKILREAYAFIGQYDSVIPVCKYPVPIEWAMEIKNGILLPYDEQALSVRSQDLIPKYHDVGMFYFCNAAELLKNKSLLGKKTYGYVLAENQVQDIDTVEDWKMAEIKFKLQLTVY